MLAPVSAHCPDPRNQPNLALFRQVVDGANLGEAGTPMVSGRSMKGSAETRVPELSTVADDEVVVHVGARGSPCEVVQLVGLEPDTEYQVEGLRARTLPRPPGQLLATVATVNDVHFGETECGTMEGMDTGPILSAVPGEPPYPETMNRGAVAEILSLHPDAVVAKGDLTANGTLDEFEQFLACYATALGERFHFIRGNHDAMVRADIADAAPIEVRLEGVCLAVVDTTIPGLDSGRLSKDQLDWLDELGGRSDRPVLVFGHHHPWNPSSNSRPDHYFGINPTDSESLVAVFARRPLLAGYFAGHTHRNRVRRFRETGPRPWAEVACTKDYPGSWAEYRIFEGGALQVHRRVSGPAALAWSERCRALYGGLYPQYALGKVEDRCITLWTNGG